MIKITQEEKIILLAIVGDAYRNTLYSRDDENQQQLGEIFKKIINAILNSGKSE